MKAVVKVEMFELPNFLHVEGMPEDQVMDVGQAFRLDSEAEEFWHDCMAKWLEHVRKRRAAHNTGSEHG